MNILRNTASGHILIPDEYTYFEKRILFLKGEINDNNVYELIKNLGSLTDKKDNVLLNIWSEGGSIQAGFALYDAILSLPYKVDVFVPSYAYSMAAVLFICATGTRYMAPHSKLMLHEPLITGFKDGSTSSVKEIADNLIKNKEMICELISKHTNKSIKEVEKLCDKEHYFDIEEALKLNLADKEGGIEIYEQYR